MATNHKDDILEKLRQGVTSLTESQDWIRWLNVQRRFHRYSWGNCLLIALQQPDATQVAGYRRWQDLGRQVRKGERGIFILAPVVNRVKADDVENGEAKEEQSVRAFRAACVFDVSQTDGEELPEIAQRLTGSEPGGAFLSLKDVAARLGFQVELSDSLGEINGDCNHDKKRIRVNERIEARQAVKTLAHEIGHALLHSPETRPADASRGLVELEAESVAYVVCSEIGLDSGQYSFGYVAGWAGGGDAASKMISSSAQRINRAARQIMSELGVETELQRNSVAPTSPVNEPALV
jgi:antirestriction protein ArdC